VLGGAGVVVDWLVKMRRLPEEAMLDRLIAARAVPVDRLHALMARLAAFYRTAPAVDWAPGIYRQRLAHDIEVDAAELLLPRYGLPAATVRAILDAQRAFLASAADRFEARVRAGRVVEGHGDLRPEHICLLPEPVVIDCLEFNREFRLVDPIDELCFLALECERLGDAALGERILQGYAQASGDTLDPGLVAFHKARRACLRGTIAVWHLRDPAPTEPAKWLGRGREYVELAATHAAALR
jgi:aminoglycoside phosphotransferase family enzyme